MHVEYIAKPLVNKGNDPTEPLDECEGDCEVDDDCKGDLLCWQRQGSQPIPPGCSGHVHAPNHDYCWDPKYTKLLVNKGNDPTEPLGQCEGDCEDDSDCRGGMQCYQRTNCGTGCIPPGCKGTPQLTSHDYCWGGEYGDDGDDDGDGGDDDDGDDDDGDDDDDDDDGLYAAAAENEHGENHDDMSEAQLPSGTTKQEMTSDLYTLFLRVLKDIGLDDTTINDMDTMEDGDTDAIPEDNDTADDGVVIIGKMR